MALSEKKVEAALAALVSGKKLDAIEQRRAGADLEVLIPAYREALSLLGHLVPSLVEAVEASELKLEIGELQIRVDRRSHLEHDDLREKLEALKGEEA